MIRPTTPATIRFWPISGFVFEKYVRTVGRVTAFPRFILVSAGLLGLTGVALGAFGAHGLKATLAQTGGLENWKTAVLYQLVHASALLGLANVPLPARPRIAAAWTGGAVLFSGSLYWLALGGPAKLIWPLTPLGGLVLLAGWAGLIASALRRNP